MPSNSGYNSKRANVLDLANNAKEVLDDLHTCVEECCLVALPTVDDIEDTRPLGFSDNQLYVLKTCPILGHDQPRISMTDEQRNTILVQSINSAQDRINKMEDRVKDDYYHILVTGDINSGKSIFINGLLRRDILPSGRRSLTSTFVEILDAQDIGGKEELHLCRRDMDYDCKNDYAFKREKVDNLYDIMCDWNSKYYHNSYDTIKVYVDHRHIHANFLSNSERKVHIIDSVGLNTSADETRFLFKKQQETDVLILIIDASDGLTESSTNIMKHYCEERTQLFVIITHLDCVCLCKGVCRRLCKEVCKQKIMNAIEEISPETVASANELIHCVNPTLIPMWDDNTGRVVGEMPSEWANMEACLHTFIYRQFDFHKLSPIMNYLQKVMHDVILLAPLNVAALAPMIDEMARKILQLENSIGQLEEKHDKAYLKAKNKIDETKSDIRDYILRKMNDLKGHPEKLISREMISHINLRNAKNEFHRLLWERWEEIEKEFNQKVNECIQNCKDYIDQLVRGLPQNSTHKNFIRIKSMLQDVDFDAFGSRKPEKSLKSRVEEAAHSALLGLNMASMQTRMRITYQTPMDKIIKYSEKSFKPTIDSDEGMDKTSDERRYTPFNNATDRLFMPAVKSIEFPMTTSPTIGTMVLMILAAAWKYIKNFFMGISIDEVHEEAKRIVREALSKENFAEDQAAHATKIAETHLLPLLNSQISECYAVAITEQINQFVECCEETARLNNEKVFFQQLKEKATQIYTNVNRLQF